MDYGSIMGNKKFYLKGDSANQLPANIPYARWICAWWNWFYSIEEKANPAYSSEYGMRYNDYNQGRVPADWSSDAKDKVWFLSGAYGTNLEGRSIITVGRWSILIPVYNMGASSQEFPSLKDEDLQNLVKDDVDGVVQEKLQATLDEENLKEAIQRVEWKDTDWFDVKGIPEENVLALDTDIIRMVSDGYWLFLKELQVGDHRLVIHGESNNYLSDKTYNITVRGPPR